MNAFSLALAANIILPGADRMNTVCFPEAGFQMDARASSYVSRLKLPFWAPRSECAWRLISKASRRIYDGLAPTPAGYIAPSPHIADLPSFLAIPTTLSPTSHTPRSCRRRWRGLSPYHLWASMPYFIWIRTKLRVGERTTQRSG